MEPQPWYRKKRYLVPAGLFAGVYSVGFMAGDPTPAPAKFAAPVVIEAPAPTEAALEPVFEEKKTVSTPAPEPVKAEAQAQTVAPVITKKEPTPAPAPTTVPAKQSCNPNYSGCLKPDASDYDCAGGSGDGPYYTGVVQVIGHDEYGLDRDKDGWACEK